MLRRIAIKGFKSLLDVDLELPRLAVLAGPNAAGKSNLLDGLQMLARAGTQRTLADALAPPIRGFPNEAFALPPGGLSELLQARSASFAIEADFELAASSEGGTPERLRYRLGVTVEPASAALWVSDEYLTRMTKDWRPKDLPRIEPSDGELLVRQLGRGGRPSHEELGVNHTKLSDARLSGKQFPQFDLLREELRRWRTYYLDPGASMRAEAAPREVPDIGAKGEHIAPFLYSLKTRQPKAFAAVRRALRTIIPAIGDLDVDLDTTRGTLDIRIEQDGTVFSSRIVSEGTLRTLALCAIAVTAEGGLVAFEEPENGVQPQRLDRIAELLSSVAPRRGAQLVLTTHSPDFVAAMLERARPQGADIGLFSVTRDAAATSIRPVADFGLWTDEAVKALLEEPDDADRLAALVRRGWLNV